MFWTIFDRTDMKISLYRVVFRVEFDGDVRFFLATPKSMFVSISIDFFDVFCDFFKSYGSKPLTLIMFFVVLWEVVSPLRVIFDIMTQNRENRKKRVPK